MWKRLLFVFLITIMVSVIASNVNAASRLSYDNTTEKHLPGEADQYTVWERTQAHWVNAMYKYQTGDLPADYYKHWSVAHCPICTADESYWSVNRDVSKSTDSYYCSACRTAVKYKYYSLSSSSALDVIRLDGTYGSPFIGHATLITDSVARTAVNFISYIASNPFTLIAISIPIIGIALGFVLRMRKGA